jgi:hypoxanthine phosphoribosyltransferase
VTRAAPLPHEVQRFAHAAERRVAAILDFYGVRWEYEPTTFVLERGPDGRPRSAFTPDFYLPDHDVYIELTTARQALVTKKNAKARRLRELHPEVQLTLLYQRDVERLLRRFAASGGR